MIDYALGGFLAFISLIGLARGMMKELVLIMAWVSSMIISDLIEPYLRPFLAQYISHPEFLQGFGSTAIFSLTFFFVRIIGNSFFHRSKLDIIDRILGVIFAFSKGMLILVIMAFTYERTNMKIDILNNSKIFKISQQCSNYLFPIVARSIKTIQEEDFGIESLQKNLQTKDALDNDENLQ